MIMMIATTTGRSSLEVAPATSGTFLAVREFTAGCYLVAISNSNLLFNHDWQSELSSCFPPVTMNFQL